MGDAQFTKMLAELRRRYEWKTIDTEQFRLLCAEFLPKGRPDPKLENFFDQWVYGTGLPALKLSYSVKGKPGRVEAHRHASLNPRFRTISASRCRSRFRPAGAK